MKRIEKHLVLNALVSELRYFNNEHLKRNSKYSLTSGHAEKIIELFHKLNNSFFKNDNVKIKGNVLYLDTILKEIKEMQSKKVEA